jgi:hypothetical protein
MLIVERTHRDSPVEYAEVFNIRQINHTAFQQYIRPRLKAPWKLFDRFARVPQQWADARIGTVVSHSLRNGLNYMWMEALHAGLALVHNSELMPEGCGYYYHWENVTAGTEALQRAVETHNDAEAESQRRKCLWHFSTSNPVNVEWYERLLDETLAKSVQPMAWYYKYLSLLEL